MTPNPPMPKESSPSGQACKALWYDLVIRAAHIHYHHVLPCFSAPTSSCGLSARMICFSSPSRSLTVSPYPNNRWVEGHDESIGQDSKAVTLGNHCLMSTVPSCLSVCLSGNLAWTHPIAVCHCCRSKWSEGPAFLEPDAAAAAFYSPGWRACD